MQYQQIKEDTGMIVLVYPDGQREDIDLFLFAYEFREPSTLIGKHATTTEIAWQTKEQTCIREFKAPQLIEDVEVIDRNPDTETHFIELLETYSEYLRDTKFIQIVKLFCVFDQEIANTPKEELIVEERIGQNYSEE